MPAHRFQYSTSWAYLDLAEVDDLVRSSSCLSNKRFAPASYRRVDHFGDSDVSMTDTVYELVQRKAGVVLDGPIRLLTQLRHFGVYFSPINVFYCFDQQETVVAVVAEVSNTPWNERHHYVLWEGNRRPEFSDRYSHPKEFHVSPFMGMDLQYEWRICAPADKLHLSLGCDRDGDRIFQADLHLKRCEITDGQLVRSMLRRPVAAAHVLTAIYYQALRLWMKKCQFYSHPQSSHENKTEIASPVTDRNNSNRLKQG